jgi:hypothetical protein
MKYGVSVPNEAFFNDGIECCPFCRSIDIEDVAGESKRCPKCSAVFDVDYDAIKKELGI